MNENKSFSINEKSYNRFNEAKIFTIAVGISTATIGLVKVASRDLLFEI